MPAGNVLCFPHGDTASSLVGAIGQVFLHGLGAKAEPCGTNLSSCASPVVGAVGGCLTDGMHHCF